MHPNNKGIILDFFAGSASTAHSVMELNSEDLGLRTFICTLIPQHYNLTLFINY